MTTYSLPQAPTEAPATPRQSSGVLPMAAPVVAAVVAGVVLGVADVAWSVRGGPLWTAIGNSCAGWATAAFVLGYLLRLGAVR